MNFSWFFPGRAEIITDAIMNICLKLFVISCLALLPASAFADVSLQQNVKIEARGPMSVFEFEGTIVTEISGEMSRIENHHKTTSSLLVSLPESTKPRTRWAM